MTDKEREILANGITVLEYKLNQLEHKIRELEHQSDKEDRKGTAKKERAAKEKDKPKSVVEKNQLTHGSRSSGDSSTDPRAERAATIISLKILAVKAKGQIVVAKQKLAAL